MMVERPPEFYFFDTSHPPKLRSALVVLADQIWTQTLMTAVIAVPNSALITEVIRFPLECFFPRHFYVPETIVFVGHVVWIWRDRDAILWQMSFMSGEDLVNHTCIHPTVREVLWFAPFIPTYVYVTLLIRYHPWLFWNIFWCICTPVLSRLAALVGFFIATNTWAFFAGERRVRIVQGVIATVVDFMHSKVVRTCCRAPRPLMYFLFWVFDLIQDGIELFRRRTTQAAILTSRPPENPEFRRYRHFPLADAKRQIRLLRLHGGLGNIQGTLINVPLDTTLSYEAISWAWDTPAEQGTNTLLIDGMELGISPNMYRILSLLVPIRDTRLVWIDAICIDQTSRSEKQDQIPLMTKIYASAERVVAFPGEGPLADLAAEFIGDLDLHLATRFSPQMFPHVDRSDHFPYRDRQKAWTAFFQLVQLRFWTRAWIIQELVVAKSVVIRHGRSEIPFDLLGRVVQAFKAPIQGVIALSADDILVYSGDYEAGRYGLDFIGRLHFLRQMYHLDANAVAIPMPGPTRDVQRKGMPAFPDLLVECVQSEATMPHDKVWALCGIVRNAYGKLDFLQPNYALPKTKIYADTARHVLRTGGTRQFALFGIAGANKPHDPASPSWIPDLAQTPQLYPIDNAICPYRAGGRSGRSSAITFSPDGTQISLTAYFLDTVHLVDNNNLHVLDRGHRHTPSDFSPTLLNERMAKFRAWLLNIHRMTVPRSNNAPASGGITLPTPVLRALIHDNDGTNVPASMETVSDLGVFVSVITSPPFSHPTAATRWEALSDEEIRLRTQRAVQLISRATSGRQFAVSKMGRAMVVPGEARAGDAVVVLEGGRVPYLMRGEGEGGRYRLVGEGYVQGVMMGEWWEGGGRGDGRGAGGGRGGGFGLFEGVIEVSFCHRS